MAEGQRERFAFLISELTRAYVDIHQAYLELPLPIRLPPWDGAPGIRSVRVAILSAVERIDDLPVEEDAAATLSQASLQWGSATALTQAYRDSGDDTIFEMASWNATSAAVLGELALALLRQG